MFRAAELGRTLDKETYARRELSLRPRLIEVQRDLRELEVPVLVVIGGVDGAGKGSTVDHLMEWMDPRGIDVHALEEPTDEEGQHPPFWTFWRRMVPRGRVGIFLGSWYTFPILRRVYGEIDPGQFERRLDQVRRFERHLVDEGVLLLKYWMHLSKKAQKKRLKALHADKRTRYRVTKRDWKNLARYDDFYDECTRALRRTSTTQAPWEVVEGSDGRFQNIAVTECLLERMEDRRRLERKRSRRRPRRPKVPREIGPTILSQLDLSPTVSKKRYEKEMEKLRERAGRLARACYEEGRQAILVFEGCDAAGKGGAIRRLTRAMHARYYHVVPIAAPTPEELRYPYLWRFWRHVPKAGHVTIFDRSWYGRVLVERVEGLCRVEDWRRAYGEICVFEDQLVRHGIGLRKFWLHISQEEQLQRFEARERTPWKRWKITDEDWRNREKWPLYEKAVAEMIDRTEAPEAPWILVPAEDKRHARLVVLREACELLESLL